MHELIREELVVSPWTTQELDRLNAQYRTRSPQELLTWAADHFGPQVVLTCSFSGASGMVLLDMAAKLDRALPVLFLDTDLMFPETYALAETAARRYGITIQHRHPSITLEEQERREGPELYSTDPDRCCGIRKVAPLAEALRPYHAWISGIRRDQSATRARTNLLQWNERHHLLKISPLAFWTEREVWTYIHANEVPYNPLLDQGYPSIGCVPCTRPGNLSSDLRAGRWAGQAKTECGIHM